ncbi:hypothetical protein QE152_g22800 [Popillia japonica]|uniref:Reverse transcriptase n=1 Tax=Popillia japonica TaxID=7064 RepID=A0AAW1KJZ4_POPJA
MRSRLFKIATTADPLTATVLQIPAVERFYQTLLRWTEGNGGNTTNINKEWGRKLQESYSGNGLRQGSTSGVSGNWVRNPPNFWSGTDFINAVKLRGNLLPTKGIPSNPPHERRCRAGCNKTESLSHVLQGCPLTHWHRIRRHDRVAGRLRQISERNGWIVEEATRLRLADGSLRKPDLTMVRGDTIVVCDITIVWEGPNPLTMAYQQKVAYYRPTHNILPPEEEENAPDFYTAGPFIGNSTSRNEP